MRLFFLFALVLLKLVNAYPQGFEGIIVENYYKHNRKDTLTGIVTPGSVTYRIYIDLEPGYHLQSVFAVPGHPVCIQTSTFFFNHQSGEILADSISPALFKDPGYILDSWMSFGASSKVHAAVLLNDDPDGSIFPDPAFGKSDGMLNHENPELVIYKLNPEIFYYSGISKFYSDDFLIGSFGGVMGIGPDNRILIAQLTTNGELSFKLNLQIGKDDQPGIFIQYVAENPLESELFHEDLSFGTCN